MLDFSTIELKKSLVIMIICLAGDDEKKNKIRQPNAMHQARWIQELFNGKKKYWLQSPLIHSCKSLCKCLALKKCFCVKGTQTIFLLFESEMLWKNCQIHFQSNSMEVLPTLKLFFGRNVILSLFDNEAEKHSKKITVINWRRENLHLGKRNILSDKELSVSLCRRWN